MFKDSNNTKGHGSIRKNKVYGAVGVLALGAAAIVGGKRFMAPVITQFMRWMELI